MAPPVHGTRHKRHLLFLLILALLVVWWSLIPGTDAGGGGDGTHKSPDDHPKCGDDDARRKKMGGAVSDEDNRARSKLVLEAMEGGQWERVTEVAKVDLMTFVAEDEDRWVKAAYKAMTSGQHFPLLWVLHRGGHAFARDKDGRTLMDLAQKENVDVTSKGWKLLLRVVTPQVTCSRETGVFLVKAFYLHVQEIVRGVRLCPEAKVLVIFAMGKVFLGRDLNLTGLGLQLVVISPEWHVMGPSRRILLDGLPGKEMVAPKAKDGRYPGGTGSDGRPGSPGGPAGSLIGLYMYASYAERLLVSAKGGDGGRGQDGGDGADGMKGNDPDLTLRRVNGKDELVRGDDLDMTKEGSERWFMRGKKVDRYTIQGGWGGDGGDGGKGGRGGRGGHGGTVLIMGTIEDQTTPSGVVIEEGSGKDGGAGEGGKGGVGGQDGQEVAGERHRRIDVGLSDVFPGGAADTVRWKFKYLGSKGQGGSGQAGLPNSGRMGDSPEVAKASVPPLHRVIEDYYEAFRETRPKKWTTCDTFPDTLEIIPLVRTDSGAGRGMTVEIGVIVDKVFKHERKKKTELVPYLKKALKKILEYADKMKNEGEDCPEKRKPLTYMYGATLSFLRGLTVFPEKYLTVLKDYLQNKVRHVLQLGEYYSDDIVLKQIEERTALSKRAVLGKVEDLRFFFDNYDEAAPEKCEFIPRLMRWLADLATELLKVISETTSVAESLSLLDHPSEASSSALKGVANISSIVAEVLADKDLLAQNKNRLAGVISLMKRIQNDSSSWETQLNSTYTFDIDLSEWDVPGVLRGMMPATDLCKRRDTKVTMTDPIFTTMNIFERLQNYHSSKRLADYLAEAFYSDHIQVYMNETLAISDLAIRSGMALGHLTEAVKAFKQYVFPFARHHSDAFKYPSDVTDIDSLVDDVASRIRLLQSRKGEAKETLDNGEATYRKVTPLENPNMRKDYAFYMFDSPKSEMRKLMVGSKVLMHSCVKESAKVWFGGYHDDHSVKFDRIELRVYSNDSSVQSEVRSMFTNSQVAARMYHLGNSYYRCGGKYYVSSRESMMVEHSFEMDSERDPLFANGIYWNTREGDFVLSPFTTWVLHLQTFLIVKHWSKYGDKVFFTIEGRGQYVRSSVCGNMTLTEDDLDGFHEFNPPK